jgi:hypothetical protein
MLHLVAEYASERLAHRADADAVRALHAAYYAELARAASAGLRGRAERGWKDVLDSEIENVRRALAQLARAGRLDEATEVVWSMWPYWLAGRYLEGRMLVADLVGAPGELSDGSRARLGSVAGLLAALLSDLTAAHRELEDAVEWLGAHDDDEGNAIALAGLGIATAPFDVERARTFMLESAALCRRLDDAWSEAMVLGALGWLDVGRGDFTRDDLIERAYLLARSLGDEVATGHTATNLAELHLARSRRDEARDVLDVAFGAYAAARTYDSLSYGLEAAAGVAASEGRTEEAARLLGGADGLRDEVAVPIWGPRLTRFEALVSSARATLGDETFDARWREGRALGFDAALEAARRAVRPAELTGAA